MNYFSKYRNIKPYSTNVQLIVERKHNQYRAHQNCYVRQVIWLKLCHSKQLGFNLQQKRNTIKPMPDNNMKKKQTRSNCNQKQLVVVENKQQQIPHCSLLVFESNKKTNKKRENPFDGSCDISNLLLHSGGDRAVATCSNSIIDYSSHSPLTHNSFESKKKKRKHSTDSLPPPHSNQNREQLPLSGNSPTLNNQHSIMNPNRMMVTSEQQPLSTPSPFTSSPVLSNSSTNSFKIPQQLTNRNQTNQIPLLLSITTMGNTDSNTQNNHDSLISPHLNNGSNCSSGLSSSFFEDISSSILYLVTGKRDHERINEESLTNLTKQQQSCCCNPSSQHQDSEHQHYNRKSIQTPSTTVSQSPSFPSPKHSLPSLSLTGDICVMHDDLNPNQSKHQPFNYGNSGPSSNCYLFPNSGNDQPFGLEQRAGFSIMANTEKSFRTRGYDAQHLSEDESEGENSIRFLPSIASLLERK